MNAAEVVHLLSLLRMTSGGWLGLHPKTAATQRHTVRESPFRVTFGGWQVHTPTLRPVGR
jgi:hypothetical protein